MNSHIIATIFFVLPVSGVLGPEALAADSGDCSQSLRLGVDSENSVPQMLFRKDMVNTGLHRARMTYCGYGICS